EVNRIFAYHQSRERDGLLATDDPQVRVVGVDVETVGALGKTTMAAVPMHELKASAKIFEIKRSTAARGDDFGDFKPKWEEVNLTDGRCSYRSARAFPMPEKYLSGNMEGECRSEKFFEADFQERFGGKGRTFDPDHLTLEYLRRRLLDDGVYPYW